MKRIFLLVFAGLMCYKGYSQSLPFTLTGDISNLKAPIEWVFLSYTINNQRITDSVLVKQESFYFKGNIDEPVQAQLRIRYKAARGSSALIPFNSRRDYAVAFIEPGSNVTVASIDSFSNIAVRGSKADMEYRKLQEAARPFDTELADLYHQSAAARKNNDLNAEINLERQIDSVNAVANEVIYGSYVKNNPASPIGLYAFRNWAGYQIDAAKVEPVFMTLPLLTRNSSSGKQMEEMIKIARKTNIGQIAIDFTQNDTLGKPVKLSSFRGKYLLVDFWASWCRPCRMDNPALVETFNRYHGKGFEILGVSLDRPGAKEKWLTAIHDDGLKWWHVSDLKYWDNAVAKEYGIQAIPQNLLLDPTGKIIAKNLRADELAKKLSAIYP